MNKMKCKCWSLLAIAGFAAALRCGPSPAWAQTQGSEQSFAVLGTSAVTAAGTGTVITGDVGVAPGTSITGFPASATVTPPFAIHNNDGPAIAAQASTDTLYLSLLTGACTPLSSDQLDTQNLGPGCHSGGALDLAATGTLTLTGAGTYIFRAASSLTANVDSNVVLGPGVDPCKVFWQVTTLATLNGDTFAGTVVAETGVVLGVGATLTGRALVTDVNGTSAPVTMAGTNTIGGCSAIIPVPPPGGVALNKAFVPTTILAGGVSTLTITLSNANTGAATLTAALTDTLPGDVEIAATPNASTTCGSGGIGGGVVSAIAGGTTVSLSANSTIPGGTPGTCTVKVNVTELAGGSFLNTTSALQTSNGTAAAASATLTVLLEDEVGLNKAFVPTTVDPGGVSTLTITLSNANAGAATLSAAFTDTLPGGMLIATPPNASTTCGSGGIGGGVVGATAGGTTVSLSTNSTIPGGTPGICTVTVNVIAAAGSFLNTTSALQTSNGNAAPASATLTANSPPEATTTTTLPPVATIPAAGNWGMVILGLAFLGAMAWLVRARRSLR